MKVVFIGCVQMSRDFLEICLKNPKMEVVGVITRTDSKFNADFTSLEPLAVKYDVPCLALNSNDSTKIYEFTSRCRPDMIFCCGWSFLLDQVLLDLPPKGVLGFHPTALPMNRGRHPLIWALALGLKETASTFFLMDSGADSGPILSQKKVKISNTDDAFTLYKKVTKIGASQLKRIIPKLANNSIKPKIQNHAKANSWRKRSPQDGTIDWRMSAQGIYNLVRALTHPYPGAHCEIDGKEYKIWKTKVVSDQKHKNIEPGKILATTKKTLTVKCGDGALLLLDHELGPIKKGTYL